MKVKVNCHHLLWQRKFWNRGWARALRNFWYSKIDIPDDLHRYIHESLPTIPVPNGAIAKRAFYQLQLLAHFGVITENDGIVRRISFLMVLLENDRPTFEALSRQLEAVTNYLNSPQ